MPRQIDYVELARAIRRYYAQNTNRVCLDTFAKEVKRFLNKGEAKRLLSYYSDHEKVLVPINKKFLRFNCHQEHFNPDAVRDIFLNFDLQTRFGRAPKAKNVVKDATFQVIGNEKPVETNPQPKIVFNPSDLSDEQLEISISTLLLEKKRREDLRKVDLILKDMNMSKEDLINLLK